MSFLLPLIPRAAALVAGGYYFWKLYQKKPEEIKQDIINITDGLHVRIIFVGPNGAGKSSLINTFLSAMQNKRVKVAATHTKSRSSKTLTQEYGDYYIEDEGNKRTIITLLDTSGLAVTEGSDQEILENIKKAIDGKLLYGKNMLEKPTSDAKTEPINIVVFVYDAQAIIVDRMTVQHEALQQLHQHVAEMNLAKILVLTHVDCIGQMPQEALISNASQKLGFDKSDIQLIKCLVDIKARADTTIPVEDRVQALGVLYAVTHDGVEKKKMQEFRGKNRQTETRIGKTMVNQML